MTKDIIMKTISITEFETLVDRDDWQHDDDWEFLDRVDRQVEEWDDENESPDVLNIPHVRGFGFKISTLDGIKITYAEGLDYDEYDPESVSTGTEGLDDVWTVEGVVVVDEDGDELNADELAEYLDSDFSTIDYNSLLEFSEVTEFDVDEDEDSDMVTFTLEISNAPNVRFTGELVASTASSDNQAMGFYSGQPGCWTELALYKTKGGKFVCHQAERTSWQGERDRFSGKVCEALEEVKEFFGQGWLARDLYSEAS